MGLDSPSVKESVFRISGWTKTSLLLLDDKKTSKLYGYTNNSKKGTTINKTIFIAIILPFIVLFMQD